MDDRPLKPPNVALQTAIAAAWCEGRTAAQRVKMLVFMRQQKGWDDVFIMVGKEPHVLPRELLIGAIEQHARG